MTKVVVLRKTDKSEEVASQSRPEDVSYAAFWPENPPRPALTRLLSQDSVRRAKRTTRYSIRVTILAKVPRAWIPA